MGVIHPDDRITEDCTVHELNWPEGPPEGCFLCNEALDWSESLVYWSGSTHIALHAECADRLGSNLLKDAREAELCNGQFPHRTTGMMRAFLQYQEREDLALRS